MSNEKETAWGSLSSNGKSSGGPMMEASTSDIRDECFGCGKEIPPGPDFCSQECEAKAAAYRGLEADLVLVYDTAKEFHEATGMDFYNDLNPWTQRKFLEYYKEDHGVFE